ncbi:hypothetical protein, partial [Endozoicomonas sp. SESOKO3]
MNQLSQPSCNQGQNLFTRTAVDRVTEDVTANHGNVTGTGRIVSPVSSEPLAEKREDFTPDLVTGQKEIGISSRAVVLDVDTPKAPKIKPKPKTLKTIQGANTAILTDRQVKLIQELIGFRKGRLRVDEFIDVIDFLRCRPKINLPKDYSRSPTLLSGIIRNQLWNVFDMEESDEMREVLMSTTERRKQIFLADVRRTELRHHFTDLTEELKNDIDFLTEYSSQQGIPYGTPPKLAIPIYERLDIAAKIKSLPVLPDSFKDDDLYDQLIRSGRIQLKDLPQDILDKNEEYCLLQLSKGLCTLSEVPAPFLTKKSILDSLNGFGLYDNFIEFFKNYNKYMTAINDPDFFEEVLLKATSAALEIRMNCYVSGIYPLSDVYHYCIERYKDGREGFASLLKRLVKANPFFVIVVENLSDSLLQELIEIGKKSLSQMLSTRPEISQAFDTGVLFSFFNKVNAEDDFKNRVMNIVYPYFPGNYSCSFPEEIRQKQDAIVLHSEPFSAGESHIIDRRLRPEKAKLIIDYIEHFQFFLNRFNDKEYLDKCCTDPTVRQRLIHVLANRIIANKQLFMTGWRSCLSRQLIDDTLAYLNNPALFSELDVSGTLTEPVNPLK